MSRQLSPQVIDHATQLADEYPWIWLYEFRVPTDPLTRYRLTNYTESLEFGQDFLGSPLTYTPAPIVHSPLRQTASGDLPQFQVAVAYTTRFIMQQLADHAGLIGEPAVVRLVNLQALDDPNSAVRWDATVENSRVGQDQVTFSLGRFDLQGVQIPARRYVAAHCEHTWLSTECGYVEVVGGTNQIGGGYDRTVICPKLFEACQDRGADEAARGVTVSHPLRWGGKKGIPRR